MGIMRTEGLLTGESASEANLSYLDNALPYMSSDAGRKNRRRHGTIRTIALDPDHEKSAGLIELNQLEPAVLDPKKWLHFHQNTRNALLDRRLRPARFSSQYFHRLKIGLAPQNCH